MWIHLELNDKQFPFGELTDDDGESFATLSEMRMDRDLETVPGDGGFMRHIPGGTTLTLNFIVTDEQRCYAAVRFDKKPA